MAGQAPIAEQGAPDTEAPVGKPDSYALAALILTLKSDKKGEAQIAAKSLGELRDPVAIEPLIEVLYHNLETTPVSRMFICKAVVDALGKIGDSRAVEPIVAALADSKRWAVAYRLAMTMHGCSALESIGGTSAAIALLQLARDLARDEGESSANFALRSLETILTKSAEGISIDGLKLVAAMTDLPSVAYSAPFDVFDYESRGTYFAMTIDCSNLRKLARVELVRRESQT